MSVELHHEPERETSDVHLSVGLVLGEHRKPRNVRVDDENDIRLLDERVLAAERDTEVRGVVEGEVDDGEARLEDSHAEEFDELGECRDGSRVATEVGSDDEGLLCADEGVGDAGDDLVVQRGRLERRPDLFDADVGDGFRVKVFLRRFALRPDVNGSCCELRGQREYETGRREVRGAPFGSDSAN